jgi:hypothetical protein
MIHSVFRQPQNSKSLQILSTGVHAKTRGVFKLPDPVKIYMFERLALNQYNRWV